MANIPSTFIQTGAANPAASVNKNYSKGADTATNAAVVGGAQQAPNTTTQNVTPEGEQSTFAQLVTQSTLTVTPELAALVGNLKIGDIVSTDDLESLGVDVNLLNTSQQTAVNPLLGTQTNNQAQTTKTITTEVTNSALIGSRENTSNQPITDIAVRIANPSGQAQVNQLTVGQNIVGDSNALANAANTTTQTINPLAQVAQSTTQNTGQALQGNKLADIANNAAKVVKNTQTDIQTTSINSRSAGSGLLNQSLFTSDSEAVINQLTTNTAGQQLASTETTQTNSLITPTTSILDVDAKAELSLTKATTTSNSTPAEQVSVKIAQTVQTGANKIEIQLDPASLGKVQVQIDISADGKANVMVTAEKNETLDMLKSDSRALQDALKNAGLQTDAGSLEFGLKDQSQREFSQEQSKAYRAANAIGVPADIDADLLRVGSSNVMYQSNQALNILA